jgi:hypothetical protein
MDVKKWAKVQESLLRSQLRTIREFLREGEMPERKPRRKGKSQISIISDILLGAQKPLHVTEIIVRAREDFSVDLDRESIVSALTKKVKSGRMFKRVAPNTFALLDSASENNN